MSKDHLVTNRVESTSNGELNNYIEMGEYASTPGELVKKHFALVGGVITGTTAAAEALAEQDGNPPA